MTIETAADLTDENIAKMDRATMINSTILSFDIDDELEQIRIQALMQARAHDLGMAEVFKRMLSAFRKKDKEEEERYSREVAAQKTALPLEIDHKGQPCVTIDNFLIVMQNDNFYSRVRFNVLRNAPEILTEDEYRLWSDTDLAESKRHIEKGYSMHNDKKHSDALLLWFREQQYHPIQKMLECIEWDGEERIPQFLTRWMKAADNPYTREVSRLIFAGGVNRLYSPGCKFEDVPVLIGTAQGEGKSTIVRWLAMHDSFYSEATEMEGQRAIEQLEGAWICEVAELLALTKAKEQEAVKSYLSRQYDKYRKPYSINTEENPRRCIFIGTTNHENFLKDKTGNRRFYPVKVYSSGYWLYDHEEECKEYIKQCWAEAKVKFERGEMKPFANQDLRDEYLERQEEAMEDDWRVGAIEKYLNAREVGELVCVRQLKREALTESRDTPQDPTPKESQEIATLMNKFTEWEKVGLKYTEKYGRQRCWQRVSGMAMTISDELELPFL